MEKIVSFLPLERPLPGPENEARTYVWQTLASAPPPFSVMTLAWKILQYLGWFEKEKVTKTLTESAIPNYSCSIISQFVM